MADKFRRTFPLRITFSDAEQPSSQKLNAVSLSARNGLALSEKAIGDLWNQAGDAVLNSYPLLIPNLARMIGQNKYLNPVLYQLNSEFLFTEKIGVRYPGKSAFHLLYKPKAGTLASITVTGTNLTGSSETNERDVIGYQDYWIDMDTGRFRSYNALSGDETISYTVDPSEWVLGQETLPGIIPDPRQTDFTGCRVELSGGFYYLHLPPRQFLTNLDADRETPTNYPLASEVFGNSDYGVSTPKSLWQQSTANALAHEHYRYALPLEIQEAITNGDLVAGDDIPEGFMYLYDADQDVLIEDVIFSIPLSGHTGYTLKVSSNTYSFAPHVTTSDAVANYNSTNLVLVTCGSPLARTLWSQIATMYKHQHSKGTILDTPISHTDALDANPPSAAYTVDSHDSRYPAHLPSWFPSNWVHDTHTSLLSRAGSQASGYERDTFNNAMLGDLIMASADTTGAENYLDSTNDPDSFKICFGDIDGPNIFGVSATTVAVSDMLDVGVTAAGKVQIMSALSVPTITLFGDPAEESIFDGDVLFQKPVAFNGTIVIENTSGDAVLSLFANNDRAAVFRSEDDGPAYLSNADNFYSNSKTGNTWMNIGGEDGVNLRYGHLGSSNEGTIGFSVDDSGHSICANDLQVPNGGVTIGIPTITNPTPDTIHVGDYWFNLQKIATQASLNWETNARTWFDNTNTRFNWTISSGGAYDVTMRLRGDVGLTVINNDVTAQNFKLEALGGKVELGDAGEYITGDGTNVDFYTSAAQRLRLAATSIFYSPLQCNGTLDVTGILTAKAALVAESTFNSEGLMTAEAGLTVSPGQTHTTTGATVVRGSKWFEIGICNATSNGTVDSYNGAQFRWHNGSLIVPVPVPAAGTIKQWQIWCDAQTSNISSFEFHLYEADGVGGATAVQSSTGVTVTVAGSHYGFTGDWTIDPAKTYYIRAYNPSGSLHSNAGGVRVRTVISDDSVWNW